MPDGLKKDEGTASIIGFAGNQVQMRILINHDSLMDHGVKKVISSFSVLILELVKVHGKSSV